MASLSGEADDIRSLVPAGIAPLCRTMAIVGAASSADVIALDAASIGPALTRFAATFWQPDVQAVASLWSMFYFNALIVPTAATLLGCDRILPVAIAAIRLELDRKGAPERVYIADGGRLAGRDDDDRRLATLVDRQLLPFVTIFSEQTGLSPRLLWSNAATVLDYVAGTIAEHGLAKPRAEVEGILAGRYPGAGSQLAQPFRTAPDGSRERKICCTRHRLSGIAPCPTICPGRNAYLGIGGATARRHGPDDHGPDHDEPDHDGPDHDAS